MLVSVVLVDGQIWVLGRGKASGRINTFRMHQTDCLFYSFIETKKYQLILLCFKSIYSLIIRLLGYELKQLNGLVMNKIFLSAFLTMLPFFAVAQYQNRVSSEFYDDFLKLQTKEHSLSPVTAVLLSVGTTVVPVTSAFLLSEDYPNLKVTLILSGAILGPSSGLFYTRDTGLAFRGMGNRVAGTGVILVGGSVFFADAFKEEILGGNKNDTVRWAGYGIIFAGLGYIVFSGVRDTILAERSARASKLGIASNLSISPVYNPELRSLGLSMNIDF